MARASATTASRARQGRSFIVMTMSLASWGQVGNAIRAPPLPPRASRVRFDINDTQVHDFVGTGWPKKVPQGDKGRHDATSGNKRGGNRGRQWYRPRLVPAVRR